MKSSCFTSHSQTGYRARGGGEEEEGEDVALGAVQVQSTAKGDLFTIWLLRRWQHLEVGLEVPQKCCQESN